MERHLADLRFVASAMKIATNLERVGDQAVNSAQARVVKHHMEERHAS